MEIIAEIGQNHNGDIGLAIEMMRIAKENGADAVKFQLYDARKLFSRINNPWYDYNCRTELSREDVFRLAKEARGIGIEFFASVFDAMRVDWLEEAGVKRHKIASRSIFDNELINRICRTQKPILVSLGMWDKPAFPVIKTTGKVDFLYCVSKYPAPLSEMNLKNVDFNKYTGLSDHTVSISAAIYAFTRGAKIIEKHFTLDKKMYGPDHSGSMTPEELKAIHQFRIDLKEIIQV